MRSFYRYILLGLALLLAAACGQNTPQVLPTLVASPTPIPPKTTPIAGTGNIAQALPTLDPEAKPGTIRVVHAAADTAVLNVYAGFLSVATNLDFRQSTEPTPLDAGDYIIQIAPSGSRPGDTPLFEAPFTLESSGADILVVAKNNDQFQLLKYPETILPLNSGESIITLVNAVSGAANVTVQRDNANLTDAIPFGEDVTTGILPSGATALSIQAGGEAASIYDIELEERQHYTLILTGTPEQVSVAQFSTTAPGRTAVRTINASEAISPVDVYLGDTLLAGNVEFSRPMPRQDMISGEYAVNVYPAGADRENSQPLASQILPFEAGQNIALFLIGESSKFQIVPYVENLSPTPPGEARIAFLNTLYSVATLRVETSGGQLPDVPDMGFGQPPEETLLSAESQNFYLTRAGAPEESRAVETVQNVLLEQGNYYVYLVTGRQDNQPIILSEDVGIDQSLADVNTDDQLAASTAEPILLRFVNAIADQTSVDFQVNTETVATAIAYGQGSELIPTEQSNASIGALMSGSGELLQVSDNSLESGSNYTVIAYGSDSQNVRLMILPDVELIFDGSSPHLRLINLSANTDTMLGLGFSPQDTTPAPPVEDLRRSIPGGIQRLIDDVAGSTASSVILMPLGIYDLHIIDSNLDQLATTLPGIDLAGGGHYDVLVYEANDSIRIIGFVVPYPAVSGS